MSARGNPRIVFRAEPDVIERAQEAFPQVSGRSGGLGLALRRLLHLALDEKVPVQYGEAKRNTDVDSLEEIVRSYSEPSQDDLVWAQARALSLLKGEPDRIDRLRLQIILGRLVELSR